MGCGCSSNCYSQFSFDELYLIRIQMNELEKSEKDMLLLGKLQIIGRSDDVKHARKTTDTKRQRITFSYADMGGKVLQISILKRGIRPENIRSAPLPRIIPAAGMSQERQEYLYSKIRGHVWPQYRYYLSLSTVNISKSL